MKDINIYIYIQEIGNILIQIYYLIFFRKKKMLKK